MRIIGFSRFVKPPIAMVIPDAGKWHILKLIGSQFRVTG